MKKLILFLIFFKISLLTLKAQPGTLDTLFHAPVGSWVGPFTVQKDGKIIMGYNGFGFGPWIIRVNSDGSWDSSFTQTKAINGYVHEIILQLDGKILVNGNFYNDTSFKPQHIARLNKDGSLDSTFKTKIGFNGNLFSNFSAKMILQTDQKIIIAGDFDMYNGITNNGIIRLNTDGTQDMSFVYSPIKIGNDIFNSGRPFSIALQPDGKIIVGGEFRSCEFGCSDTAIKKSVSIFRLNKNGLRDLSFNVNVRMGEALAKEAGHFLALQSDGKIVYGPQYENCYAKILRLNINGTYDNSFNSGIGFYRENSCNPNIIPAEINSIAIQQDNKIIVGGRFDSYNNTNRSCITQLLSDGNLDTLFDPDSGFSGGGGAYNSFPSVSNVFLQKDGKILIAGNYDTYNGNAQYGVASRLTADTINISKTIFYNQIYSNSNPKKLDFATVINSNPKPIKICADGSKATFLEFYNYDSTIKQKNIAFKILEDTTNSLRDIYGFFDNPTDENTNPQIKKVFYNHPTFMGLNTIYRNATIQIYDKSNNKIIYQYPIEIYRAPLLMVHGLDGTMASFSNFEKLLLNNNLYPQIQGYSPLTLRADYSKTNVASFETNKDVVRLNVEKLLNQVVTTNKYSAGKVDIVAHSMGGIVSRLYIQNPYLSSPYRGDVHKLIMFNTPHSGTQLADFGIQDACPAFSIATLFIPGGLSILLCPAIRTYATALVDLGTTSEATDKYLNGPTVQKTNLVPTMALTSTTIPSFDDPDCNWFVESLSPQLDLFNGLPNDGVVPVISQQGGISPVYTPVELVCHIGAMNDLQMFNNAVTLINNPPTSQYFDVDGYVPSDLNYPSAKPKNNSPSVLQSVQFTTPSDNAVSAPGQLIKVKALGSLETKKLQLIVGNEIFDPVSFDTSGKSLNYNYTVPTNAAGEMRMIVFGYDSLYNYAFDTVRIIVSPKSTLDSIHVYPSNITVPENLKTSFEITGYFHDGYSRIISSLPDVQYVIADTNVATHTVLNEIAGKKKDTTSITISYKGITAKVPVQVLDGSDYLHAGFVSFDTSICPGKTASFTNYSSGNPISYNWKFTGGSPSTSSLQDPVVTYANTGQYDVTLITTYANKNDTLTLSKYINVSAVIPAKPGVISQTSGNAKQCPGDSATYRINAVANASSYQWTAPPGSSIISGQGTVSVKVLYKNGFTKDDSIRVVAVSNCGSSLSRALSVKKNTAPGQPGTISIIKGNSKLCPGDSATYSINAVANTNSYLWTAAKGGIIKSGQGTTTITVLYNSTFISNDTLKVIAVNNCGTSTARALLVSRNNPATPDAITGQNFGVCALNNIVYSVTNVAGITYGWSFNGNNATILNGQGTYKIKAGFNASFNTDTLAVTANNGCGASTARTLLIKGTPALPTAITGQTSVCANQTNVQYATDSLQGAKTYTWTAPKNAKISDGITTSTGSTHTTISRKVSINFGTNAGKVSVNGNNDCGIGPTKSISISINCIAGVSSTENIAIYKEGLTCKILPNPAKGNATAFISNASGEVALILSDMSGKQIWQSGKTSSTNISIPIQNLAKGTYMVIVKDEKKSVTMKFIKE